MFSLTLTTPAQQEDPLPIPDHIEFVSQWFPPGAKSALYAEIDRASRLATTMHSTPAQFGVVQRTLDLIRENVGFDPSQIDRLTSATITVGVPGTIVFFSLKGQTTAEDHFSTGQFPITPKQHRFHNREIFQLSAEGRSLGLYSAEGKHFVLGDWDAFKTTLLGNDGRPNELATILAKNSAPIIICSNPRRSGRSHQKDAPFGKVISIDFQDKNLVFLMQEEHPTPTIADARLAAIETEMPAAFARAYGMETKKAVRYRSFADGRHVIFAAQSPVAVASRLLSHLLGETVSDTPRVDALELAELAIQKYESAKAAGVSVDTLQSSEAIIGALCVGLETNNGKRYALPFLTGIQQARTAAQLQFTAGKLILAPEVEVPTGPSLEETEIRRHAQRIAVLTMSAAAADSPELKKLRTPEEIVAVVCSKGLSGGGAYAGESFKADELSKDELGRVIAYLVPHRGYLLFKPN